ncbi:hypothetical protein EV363DRAFT_1452773 [Boletus edulis]|nr:hypothetical protein EV363DRAFT_1452773 [Boletus edulis]
MTGPEPGRYYIQLVASQKNIGADPPYLNPEYVSIITDGTADIWEVDLLDDGTYTLTIVRGSPVYTQDRDGGLVGSLNSPGSSWRIQYQKNGSYTICATDGRVSPFCWTVWRSGLSKTFVTLLPLRYQDNQAWKFIPVYDE